jgi:hypothetical protein
MPSEVLSRESPSAVQPTKTLAAAAPPAPGPAWLSPDVFRALGGWLSSMILHAVGLILLAITMLPVMLKPEPPALAAIVQRNEDEISQFLEESVVAATEFTLNTSASTLLPQGHNSTIDGAASEPVFDRQVAETTDPIKVTVGDVSVWSVKGSDLFVDVPDTAPGDPQAIVDNYDQAFDRITQELILMLLKGKVLVAWVFDQSESMKDDQQEIRDRIERVYQELGLVEAAKGDALMTSVFSYGQKWQMHTRKPTNELAQIREAINSVPIDESGLEMMSEAVGLTCAALRSAGTSGRRQLAMILVTDESGDQKTNVSVLEAALQEAKQTHCRIYTLGREAVFGYPFAHMRWRHPNGGVLWLPIDRGPETSYVEQLQTEGFQRRYDAHPSGFGPYEQARLSRETGGIFFMLPSLETDLVRGEKRRYELEAMRPYLPDLGARNEYAHERDASPLRATLWKVISDLNPYDPAKAKVIDLRLHFSRDPPTFLKQVAQEQEKARLYTTYLHEAEQVLDKLRKERDREIYPRWRANYDLILAQILAYKVRVYEYGAYLEEFKKNPKQVPLKKEPNLTLAHWDIRHRSQTITGEQTKPYIERSKEMFALVMQEHAGTPWAARAQWELKRGFGIELREVYHGPPPPPRPSGPPVKIPKL